MHKYILIFFSFWMIVTNSCALKKSVLNWVNNGDVENYYQHSEKTLPETEVSSFSICKKGIKNAVEAISSNFVFLVKFVQDSQALLLSLYASFLVSFLLFAKSRKRKYVIKTLPLGCSPPFYIQFQRLQYYA
ncbi:MULTISPECIES: hypothetical protein [Flavobacteriaceae]|uniref:Uncharacterized protein n=2 Tax=Flavobacteriaceae TaxID=49546 RepID=A3XIX6_LEEBM|nr:MULTISPECIES: hypothetical protein [Flavobacteriaceae]EAQ50497.1 hypothetical protein MED217_05677 [Leeuwenhoekiella blandensis MED217]